MTVNEESFPSPLRNDRHQAASGYMEERIRVWGKLQASKISISVEDLAPKPRTAKYNIIVELPANETRLTSENEDYVLC